MTKKFLTQLQNELPGWHEQLLAYRQESRYFSPLEVSELLLACSPVLEDFLIKLFGIEAEAALVAAQTVAYNPISAFKKFFVLRRAKKNMAQADKLPSFIELNAWLTSELKKAPLQTSDHELAIALLATQYITAPEKYAAEIEKLTDWCVQAMATPEGKKLVEHWNSFHLPKRVDYLQLVKCVPAEHDKLNRVTSPAEEFNFRDGFKLTDPRMSVRDVQDEVNYCIYCHDHDGDFCSKGFPVKKGDPELGFKKNPLDVALVGCPLEEKISEMNLLKRDGHTLASLAMVMVNLEILGLRPGCLLSDEL